MHLCGPAARRCTDANHSCCDTVIAPSHQLGDAYYAAHAAAAAPGLEGYIPLDKLPLGSGALAAIKDDYGQVRLAYRLPFTVL